MCKKLDSSTYGTIGNSKIMCLLLAFAFSIVFFSFSYFLVDDEPEIKVIKIG